MEVTRGLGSQGTTSPPAGVCTAAPDWPAFVVFCRSLFTTGWPRRPLPGPGSPRWRDVWEEGPTGRGQPGGQLSSGSGPERSGAPSEFAGVKPGFSCCPGFKRSTKQSGFWGPSGDRPSRTGGRVVSGARSCRRLFWGGHRSPLWHGRGSVQSWWLATEVSC